MVNLRAKKRTTFSKSHALAIVQEAKARGMNDVHLYRKRGLLRTSYTVTYLDKSRGEKVKVGVGKVGKKTGGLLSKLRKK